MTHSFLSGRSYGSSHSNSSGCTRHHGQRLLYYTSRARRALQTVVAIWTTCVHTTAVHHSLYRLYPIQMIQNTLPTNHSCQVCLPCLLSDHVVQHDSIDVDQTQLSQENSGKPNKRIHWVIRVRVSYTVKQVVSKDNVGGLS